MLCALWPTFCVLCMRRCAMLRRYPMVVPILQAMCPTCNIPALQQSGPAPVLMRLADLWKATPDWERYTAWIESHDDAKTVLGGWVGGCCGPLGGWLRGRGCTPRRSLQCRALEGFPCALQCVPCTLDWRQPALSLFPPPPFTTDTGWVREMYAWDVAVHLKLPSSPQMQAGCVRCMPGTWRCT